MTDLTTFLAGLRHEATMAERKDEWARKIQIDPAVALALLDVVQAAERFRMNGTQETERALYAALASLASKP